MGIGKTIKITTDYSALSIHALLEKASGPDALGWPVEISILDHMDSYSNAAGYALRVLSKQSPIELRCEAG